jgi:hypothetical protein
LHIVDQFIAGRLRSFFLPDEPAARIVGQKVNMIGCRIWRLIWCSGR